MDRLQAVLQISEDSKWPIAFQESADKDSAITPPILSPKQRSSLGCLAELFTAGYWKSHFGKFPALSMRCPFCLSETLPKYITLNLFLLVSKASEPMSLNCILGDTGFPANAKKRPSRSIQR